MISLRAAFVRLTALAFATVVTAHAQSTSGFTYNGLNYTSYSATEYNNSTSAAATMRATGANYVAVMETQYQQTSTSNAIAPETTTSPGYKSSYPLSPTDAAVVSAIKAAQAQGLTVSLKPQVDSLDGVFRGSFAPTNPAAWFASYQAFILHYAQIASQNNVGILVIGTELKTLTKSAYKSNWETIISSIRSQYPGLTLVYAANATGAGDEFTSVSFWADVDIIGIDGYFPLTNTNDPSLAALIAAWSSNKSGYNIVAALKNLQSTYNKPLIFSEIGYVSVSGTNQTPYASITGTYDTTEQQNCYEAFFQVFSAQSAWMKGVFWWDWTVSPPGANDAGYSPQNKPAGTATLPKWFNSTTPGFTIAAGQSTVSLGQGLTTTDVISVTNQGGFTGAVTMTVSGLPTGVTGTFSAGTVAGTQNLTLTASSTAALAGPVTVTVTGTSGAVSAATTIATTVVTPAAQTITFANPGQQKLGATIALVASSSSGLPIAFTTSTSLVCSVDASSATATMNTIGTCTITASQAGSATYAAAATVTDSFPVVAIPTAGVPASADIIVSQLHYLSNVGGYLLSGGNPAGGSIGVNSLGTVVVANNINVQLVNATTGALTNLGAWGSSAAAAVDSKDNIYLGNDYGPINSIVKLPYTGGSTNGGYAAFAAPTASTPVCTSSSTTECLLPANLGSINVSAMSFDASGDLFFVTAGGGSASGNSIYECNTTCLSGTGTPVLLYTEATASPAPSPTSGQLLIGSVAVDSAGNVFFTDSSIYVNSSFAYFSFFSNLKELPATTAAGFGGITTGVTAAPVTLYTLNTPNPSAYGNQIDGVVILRNSNGDTVYFEDENDQIFGFPDTPGGIPVVAGKPTSLYTAALQGGYDLAVDAAGNLYPVGYSSATGSGGDTVVQATSNAIVVPTSNTGTATSPSTTTAPVTTILNDVTCSSMPGASLTFTATPSSNATATLTPSTSCSSTFNGNASLATAVSFTPTLAGADSVTFTAQDQSTNSGSVVVSGIGSGFTVTPASSAVTIPQTTSAIDTILVTDFGTFNGNVTLTATGLPAGVTSAFATNPATNSSDLTLTASSTAMVGGPYNITVTGTSGTQTATTTIAASVSAAPSFTLTTSAASASIPQGNSTTSTISVNPISTFNGNVTLTATGLPTGVTATFDTNPATTTSVLTLTASSTAAASGPAIITITGTSGTQTATTTVSVTVTAAASYKIAASASSVAITQGNSGTDTITVTPVNGFASGVTLSASGLPLGVTAAFSPNPTTTSSSVLTLTAASTATVGGPVTVTITGTSGTLTQTTTFALTINAAPGFTLVSTPATVAVAESGMASNTVTITDVGGFTGSVTLVATGLPAGVTASFATNPATATSVVTFSATATATTGPATVTITGTSGTTTSTTTIPLTVTPPASFTISSATATLSVRQNGTANDTITVTGANGFNGSVNLAATGLPTGVTATFSANPTTGSSVVTFSATGLAPAGTSTVTITGTSGTLSASTTIALTTASGPNFTLSPAASTVSIVQGATATDVVTITNTGGFTGMVAFTASGVPSGVTATFSSSPANDMTTLQLTASASATVGGPTNVTITGTSGNIVSTTIVALTVKVPPSFTLVAAPATVTVAQTTSITTTVTVTSVGGFTGSPTLSVTGLPTGVTASFAAGPAAGTQILTLTASATAGATSTTSLPPYSGTLIITGTSGALSSSTTLGLTIIGAPSFAITGAALVIRHGAGILNSTMLSVQATNGFAGTVVLTCAIMPVATSNPATCAINPTSVTLSGAAAQTSTLTIASTAGELVQSRPTPFFWFTGGGTALAVVLLFGMPRRRPRWMAGLLTLILAVAALGIVGCSSTPTYSSPVTGTSVGAYSVIVTGTSGATVAIGSVSLTIQ